MFNMGELIRRAQSKEEMKEEKKQKKKNKKRVVTDELYSDMGVDVLPTESEVALSEPDDTMSNLSDCGVQELHTETVLQEVENEAVVQQVENEAVVQQVENEPVVQSEAVLQDTLSNLFPTRGVHDVQTEPVVQPFSWSNITAEEYDTLKY